MTGKRKEPSSLHIPSCRCLFSKGECGDGKDEGDVVKTSRWLSSKGECGDEEVEERKKYFVFN